MTDYIDYHLLAKLLNNTDDLGEWLPPTDVCPDCNNKSDFERFCGVCGDHVCECHTDHSDWVGE